MFVATTLEGGREGGMDRGREGRKGGKQEREEWEGGEGERGRGGREEGREGIICNWGHFLQCLIELNPRE